MRSRKKQILQLTSICHCDEIEQRVVFACKLRDEMAAWPTPLEAWKKLQEMPVLVPRSSAALEFAVGSLGIPKEKTKSVYPDLLNRTYEREYQSWKDLEIARLRSQANPSYTYDTREKTEKLFDQGQFCTCTTCGRRIRLGGIDSKFNMCYNCMMQKGYSVIRIPGYGYPVGSVVRYGATENQVIQLASDGYALVKILGVAR